MSSEARDGDQGLTVGEARARFFRRNGFPHDGGYDDDFAEAEFGPVRYRVPNPPARGAALRVHDLHHLATGYPTDWRGEAEISAWELAGGLGFRYPYAWITVLFGLFTGLVAHLRPTLRAFFRGRRSKNLFGERFDHARLGMRLDELRRELDAKRNASRASRAVDGIAFVAWSVVALAFGVLSIPFVALMVLAALARRALPARCPFSECPSQAT